MPIEILGIKFYNLQETADLLQIKDQSMKSYVRSGRIAGKKIRGRWHFSEQQIKDYLNSPDTPIAEERENAE